MKNKIISILFIIVFMFIFASCKKEEKSISFSENEFEIIVGEEYILDVNLVNVEGEAIYSSDSDCIEINGQILTGIKEGEATITAKVVFDDKEYTATIIAKILPIPVTSITINGKTRMLVSNERLNNQTLQTNVLPAKAGSKELNWTSSNEAIATVSNKGLVRAISPGEVTITATSVITPSVSGSITITIVDNDTTAPVITLDDGTANISVKIDDDYDLLEGVKAIDDLEGDISDRITVDTSEFNKYKAGTYDVYYTVKDEALNEATRVKRTYTIIYDSYVKFIGHAGCYYGLMNSEEAFINAGKRGYQLVECDLKQTSDGVFVLSHDDDFNGTAINSTTYANLKKITKTSTRGGVSYTTGICTLERYLEICKEYGMKAVIELKYSAGINNNDQSRMQALMNEIEKCGMLEEVVFLGSQYNCLIWVKQHGYEYIPCQYLVNSIESESILERCDTYDLDISFNVDGSYKNSSEWIQRYLENGHEVACYTFSQYSTAETLQKWLDLNLIDYFTCDVLTAADVKLPKSKEVATATKYTVRFYDYDDKLLKTCSVVEGRSAVSPIDPKRDGYTFKSWDKDYSNITADLDVKAEYEINNYTITYIANNTAIEEKTFASKADFVEEFYTDYFNWLKDNVDRISYLTENNGTYTMSKNSVTVTFASVSDIKAIDIYDFEKTLSNFIYKPVTRPTNTTPVVPEVDENYFLNSSAYREKWINMDAYFLNACISGYSSYDRTYTPTSAGKIQIMFRFQQWQKGTNIPAFDTLPKYYAEGEAQYDVTLPTSPTTYTILDEVTIPEATSTTKTFKEWNTKADGSGEKITKIEKGTYKNIILYAIFE